MFCQCACWGFVRSRCLFFVWHVRFWLRLRPFAQRTTCEFSHRFWFGFECVGMFRILVSRVSMGSYERANLGLLTITLLAMAWGDLLIINCFQTYIRWSWFWLMLCPFAQRTHCEFVNRIWFGFECIYMFRNVVLWVSTGGYERVRRVSAWGLLTMTLSAMARADLLIINWSQSTLFNSASALLTWK